MNRKCGKGGQAVDDDVQPPGFHFRIENGNEENLLREDALARFVMTDLPTQEVWKRPQERTARCIVRRCRENGSLPLEVKRDVMSLMIVRSYCCLVGLHAHGGDMT